MTINDEHGPAVPEQVGQPLTVRTLLRVLADCDPDAVIIPGNGKFLHFVRAFVLVRTEKALAKTKEPHGTKYLEMPETGNVNVVVLE